MDERFLSVTQRLRPIAEYANARCDRVWPNMLNVRERAGFQAMDHGCRPPAGAADAASRLCFIERMAREAIGAPRFR